MEGVAAAFAVTFCTLMINYCYFTLETKLDVYGKAITAVLVHLQGVRIFSC